MRIQTARLLRTRHALTSRGINFPPRRKLAFISQRRFMAVFARTWAGGGVSELDHRRCNGHCTARPHCMTHHSPSWPPRHTEPLVEHNALITPGFVVCPLSGVSLLSSIRSNLRPCKNPANMATRISAIYRSVTFTFSSLHDILPTMA
jgi:hypothetical protein